tara:strand:- start:675 stop:1127 length:453 start_codon:yes stop_codon:yes gene_type:complete
MASTVDSATLKVQIQEDIKLNGTQRGAKIVHTFSGITQVDERILTVPTYNVNVLILSGAAGAGTYETGAFEYARLTNLDDSNFLTITVASGSEGSKIVQKLPPKMSMVLTTPSISGSAAGAAFNTFSNFTSVKASADTASIDMSLFVATT